MSTVAYEVVEGIEGRLTGLDLGPESADDGMTAVYGDLDALRGVSRSRRFAVVVQRLPAYEKDRRSACKHELRLVVGAVWSVRHKEGRRRMLTDGQIVDNELRSLPNNVAAINRVDVVALTIDYRRIPEFALVAWDLTVRYYDNEEV